MFGELLIGIDIQDSISNVEVSAANRPIEAVFIEELNIIRKGRAAKKFDAPEVFVNHFAEVDRLEKEKAAKELKIIKSSEEKFKAQKEKAITLPSGLQYVVTKQGTGEDLKETSKVLVHYAVFFENGKLLETSSLKTAEALNTVNEKRKLANQYQPIRADLSPNARMISGFKEGLQQLNVGDKATLFIPYHLAYGESGNRGIPPKSNLIFEVEILEIVK